MKTKNIESYIVRIYRRGKDDSSDLVGIVEDPGKPETMAFKTRDELLAILDRGLKGRKRAGAAKKPAGVPTR